MTLTAFLSRVGFTFLLISCAVNDESPSITFKNDMNSDNTIVCPVFAINSSNESTRKTYKAEDFKIHITKNPTFKTPQVSLSWWGRLDVMGWMKIVGKYGIGNSFDHTLFKDEANKATLVKYTNSNVVSFTTSLITGEPVTFSANCPY